MRENLVFLVLLAGACAKGGSLGADANGGDDDGSDAPSRDRDGPSDIDGPTDIDSPTQIDSPPTSGPHLLLTEVVLQPTGGEFIEIGNPTNAAVDLEHYYLSDNGNYFNTPSNSVTVDSSDFIAHFPAGASIAAGGVVTVAMDVASNFQTAYATAPSYSVASHTMVVVSSTGTPTLTNTGEPIVLFYWDGQSDLVKDVDLLICGVPTSTNLLVDKSGLGVDGPDTGSTPSNYGADAMTIAAQASAPGSGFSTKRIAPETGHEHQSGTGNGITGDDETSEDTSATWDTTFTAPTPGTVPSGLL
ncbi:MAG TPA: lamin tail domain-containing protein [Kofleriaceae bacterium]|jgi:hypothetical protein